MKTRGLSKVQALLPALLIAAAPTALLSELPEGSAVGRLEDHVRRLADDSLEGRLVGTAGIEEAAGYIAEEFRASGLEPLIDTLFMQEFSLDIGYEVKSHPTMVIGERAVSYGDEFQVLPISGSKRLEGLTAFISETEEDRVAIDVPRKMKGYIVFCTVNTGVEADRWTLKGKDGLLEYMAAIAREVAGFGASAVVFVNGSPDSPRAGLHFFPLNMSYEAVEIPVLEIAYSALEEALMFEGITLKSLFARDSSRADPGELKSFLLDGPRCRLVVETGPRIASTSNVVGLVRGRLRPDEYVVVGAHYDHLGYGDIASSTPWRREVHNGADDNASGTAALIEIARAVAEAEDLLRSVVFIAFTAEEMGALGSRYYRDNPLRPLEKTVTMVNLDTVGRLDAGKLIVFGAESATEFESLLISVNAEYSLELVPRKEIFGFSDQNAFVEAGIPSLHFFTGAYDDYHSPDDDWQNLDYQGLAIVSSFAADFVVAVANAETRPTPVEGLGQSPEIQTSRGKGAHLGIVPDFTHAGTGVRLKGTVARSPAEAAGLMEGDVILAVDGEALSELRDLMIILSRHKPGDIVQIKVARESGNILLAVELGVRQPVEDQKKQN
jgi:hypothetical protein